MLVGPNREAQANLAYCYKYGEGAEVDVKEEWYNSYPILGYQKGWDNKGHSDFKFTGRRC